MAGTAVQIGPCAIEPFADRWLAVRCPRDLEHLVQRAGGFWEPGSMGLAGLGVVQRYWRT